MKILGNVEAILRNDKKRSLEPEMKDFFDLEREEDEREHPNRERIEILDRIIGDKSTFAKLFNIEESEE